MFIMSNNNRVRVFELEQELKKFRFGGYCPVNGVNFRGDVINSELLHRYSLLYQKF